jgi:MinD superfamily P-loop ATPase
MESKKTLMVTNCKIRIDYDLCLSCAACPAVCPNDALLLHALRLELIMKLCDNCLLCIPTCPVGAIKEESAEI